MTLIFVFLIFIIVSVMLGIIVDISEHLRKIVNLLEKKD